MEEVCTVPSSPVLYFIVLSSTVLHCIMLFCMDLAFVLFKFYNLLINKEIKAEQRLISLSNIISVI